MNEMNWIMSEGGPLICVENRWAANWGGVDHLTVEDGTIVSDYDRACRSTKYLEAITLLEGRALVIGDAPLDTAVWRSPAGVTFLVRVWYCDPNFDLDAAMRKLNTSFFEKPEESLLFAVSSPDLTIFDSAEAGDDRRKKSVPFSLLPGAYTILTKAYEPSSSASLILHRFDLL